MTNKQYNKWLEEPKMPAYLIEELKAMSEAQKEESFFQDLEFGTGGLRGILGAGTNKMNIFTVQKATLGLALHLKNQFPNRDDIKVAMSSDSRHFSKEFIQTSAEVLATYGIKSVIFEDIKPTPMLSYLVREEKCDAGIMITASHNPREYNGYKVYNNTGSQLNLDESDALLEIINGIEDIFTYDFISDASDFMTFISDEYDEKYLKDIESVVDATVDVSDVKIVFTPEHGTSYKIMPKAFKKFGFNNVINVEEQMTPDGDFPNTKSSNPEEMEAYELALEYMKKHDADIAVANDPDADRLGIVVKNANGEFIPMSGNQTGTLMINYLVNKLELEGNEVVYKTIVTGEMGANIAREKDITIEETLTGFKFIGDKLKNLEDNGSKQKFIFGYEESYGYLLKGIARDKDAIQATVLICEMVAYYKEQGLTLVDVLNSLYDQYGFYSEVTYAIGLKGMEGLQKIHAVMEYVRTHDLPAIDGVEIESKVDYKNDDTGLPKTDVVKFYVKGKGWIVFRPSGTEPKIKIYVSIKEETLEKSEELNKLIYTTLVDKLEIKN